MSVQRIARILEMHFVPYYIACDRIIADSMIGSTKVFEQIIDLTGYTKEKLLSWLGY